MGTAATACEFLIRCQLELGYVCQQQCETLKSLWGAACNETGCVVGAEAGCVGSPARLGGGLAGTHGEELWRAGGRAGG